MAYTRIRDPLSGETSPGIRRDADGAVVPADPANEDWCAYQAWLAAGNTPTAAGSSPPGQPTTDT